MIPISESVVRATARIMGESSAAARAIREAEERRVRGEEVAFFKTHGSIIVAGLGRATKERE